MPTDYTYTGQYSNVPDFGLMFYNARWYDPYLSRFTQADSIIPLQTQGVQAWDRYAYVNNNPLKYTDPSGHCILGCIVESMLIGAAISTSVNIISQQINIYSGKQESIDWAQVGGAAVGGAFFTMAIIAAPATTTIGAAMAVGAIAGVASGAVGTYAEGTIDAAMDARESQTALTVSDIVDSAVHRGITDPIKIAGDAAGGAVAYGATRWVYQNIALPTINKPGYSEIKFAPRLGYDQAQPYIALPKHHVPSSQAQIVATIGVKNLIDFGASFLQEWTSNAIPQ